MRRKVYNFRNGKTNDNYIREIKRIMQEKPEIETIASFDKSGNYIIELLIPDWKDKFKKDSIEAIRKKKIQIEEQHKSNIYDEQVWYR